MDSVHETRYVRNVLKLITHTTMDGNWESEALQDWKIVLTNVPHITCDRSVDKIQDSQTWKVGQIHEVALNLRATDDVHLFK